MKLFFIFFAAVMFTSNACAQLSDFELGYEEGKLSCEPPSGEVWSCFLSNDLQTECTGGTYKVSIPKAAYSRATVRLPPNFDRSALESFRVS